MAATYDHRTWAPTERARMSASRPVGQPPTPISAPRRFVESLLATTLSALEPEHGDPLAALDDITLAIRNSYDSGNVAYIAIALATLAVFLDRLGHLEPAATITGFALNPLTASQLSTVIAHLRDVLGEATYESLARKGETMTTAAMVTYAYDQIDQARTELEHPG